MTLVAGVLVAGAVVCATLAGCSAPTASGEPASAPPASGATPSGGGGPSPAGGPPRITGTVTAGPVCPVERNPPDPSCAPRPVAGAVIVGTDAAGNEVGRATTAEDGTYELVVGKTGTILLTPQPVQGYMGTAPPVTVTLAGPGDVAVVDLAYDTGIR